MKFNLNWEVMRAIQEYYDNNGDDEDIRDEDIKSQPFSHTVCQDKCVLSQSAVNQNQNHTIYTCVHCGNLQMIRDDEYSF